MFALEITFKDGVSQSETVIVRRPQALIGSHEFAHVALDDMSELNYQIRVVRELGRRFRCTAISTDGSASKERLDRVYDGDASLDLGPLALHITSLDIDLFSARENEPPDRAGVRVLRQSCATASPLFPAVAILGAYPMVISFNKDQPVYVGRSKECVVRLDSSAISSQHARLGHEEGRFWVEDLGSTNGTFIGQQQLAGRAEVDAEVPIIFGREVSLIGVNSYDQVAKVGSIAADTQDRLTAVAAEPRYPILVSLSEAARPPRLILTKGARVKIGRDPSSDIWLGAPHISRTHCSVLYSEEGVVVTDHSTNGTGYGEGILRRGDDLRLEERPRVFDFGGGITVAVCFNEEQEKIFSESHGALTAFKVPGEEGGRIDGPPDEPSPPSGAQEVKLGGGLMKVLRRFKAPLKVASKLQIVIVTVTFAFALVLILSLLRGVFV